MKKGAQNVKNMQIVKIYRLQNRKIADGLQSADKLMLVWQKLKS